MRARQMVTRALMIPPLFGLLLVAAVAAQTERLAVDELKAQLEGGRRGPVDRRA